MTEISFIGLGAMGAPILSNLLSHPAVVTKAHVYNRTRKVADEFAQQESKVLVHNSPADALAATKAVGGGAGGRIVVSVVSNDAALDAVCASLLPKMREGDVHLCLSTVSPSIVDLQEARCRERLASFISCPVFGRPPVAVARKLIVVPSGDAQAIETVMPLLERISQKVVRGGDVASNSNILKLCGNFCILSFIQMHAEAFALAEGHGIPRQTAYELLSSPEGVFSKIPILATYGSIVQSQSYSQVGFSAENGLKDATLICSAAAACGLDGAGIMPLVKERLERLCLEDGGGGRDIDWAALAGFVSVRGKRKSSGSGGSSSGGGSGVGWCVLVFTAGLAAGYWMRGAR